MSFFYDGQCFQWLDVLTILSSKVGLHAMSKVTQIGKLASVLRRISSFDLTQLFLHTEIGL